MKKGFVLLIALVFAFAAFADGNSSYDSYNGYEEGYTGYDSEDRPSTGKDHISLQNMVVFNYLSTSASADYSFHLSVTLSFIVPRGAQRSVLMKRILWIGETSSEWFDVRSCNASVCNHINNSITDVTDVGSYGDGVEYRIAFYSLRGKLIGVSNLSSEYYTPAL